MLIQSLQKWWIENPSLLNCVKQSKTWTMALYRIGYGVRLVWIFKSTIFEVIELPQNDRNKHLL